MKILIRLLTVLGLLLWQVDSIAAPKDLSNILPAKLVQNLYQKKLWMKAFENSESSESLDVRSYWESLYSKQSSFSDVVQKVFSGSGSTGFNQLPASYPVKIEILRWLQTESTTERWAQIEKQVLLKYFSMTATLIKASQVTEVFPVVDQAKLDIESGRVQLKDLSPSMRLKLQQVANPIHRDINRTLGVQVEGKFIVNGVYFTGLKILAIDISRPITETLITLCHELVHMSDPEMLKARKTIETLFPYVQNQMAQILGNQAGQNGLAKAIVLDVFAELGKADALDILSKMRDQRLSALSADLENAALLDKTQDPKIQEWMQALVSATLENEIRAYILSLSVYKQLKDSMQIIPPSEERQHFINQITDGNFNFAKGLSAAMNPFNRESFASQMVSVEVSPDQRKELTIKANLCKSILEHHYLTKTKQLLMSLSQKYAHLIELLRKEDASLQGSTLPQWTQPGQFESPANPYIVLTAKISTIWVLRFKEVTQSLLADLQDMNSSLLTLKAGVLDMHDISFGELKLLGIHAPNADESVLPKEIQGRLRDDLVNIPGKMQSYFQRTQWSPTDFSSKVVIDQETLTTNLIRLRLLKSLYWIENSFPPAKENITSINVLQLKLHEGFYDHEELSDDRVSALEEQLKQALQLAGASGDELKQMKTLFELLSSIYSIADDQQWLTVSNDFSRKMETAIGLMENMGLEMNFSKDSFKKSLEININAFKEQLANAYQNTCNGSEDMSFIPGITKFKLGSVEFPLTTICYQKRLYSFRQPGDYTKSATTLIKNGAPESRVFIGARPIRLSPLLEIRKNFLGNYKP